jgi:hypothetical protein
MQRSALFILLLIVAPFAAASRAGAPYIDVSSYVKGFVRVNGNSLGRHWIFVPGRSSTPPRRGWLGGGMRFCFSTCIAPNRDLCGGWNRSDRNPDFPAGVEHIAKERADARYCIE